MPAVADGIKQVIFEYNEIKPGGAAASWGNNLDTCACIDTPPCNYTLHRYNNVIYDV
jgi:hypothetical protein